MVDNKEIFRCFYEASWNQGDVSLIDELLTPNFINHKVTTPPPHHELYKQAVRETRLAFPDWKLSIEDLIAEGEKVVVHWNAGGTHTGRGFGISPTGKRVRITGFTQVRVVDGKITEFWKKDDSHTLAQQLAEPEAVVK